MTQPNLPVDVLERAVLALPQDELSDARSVALQRFKQRGFPTLRDEDWKYSDLSNVIDISRRSLEAAVAGRPADRAWIRGLLASIDAAWLVIANGELLEDLSTALEEDDIEVSGLQPDTGARDLDDPLSDLNLALLREGVSLCIAADRMAARPVGLLIVDSADGAHAASQVRVDIRLEPQAAARFVEYHASSGDGEHYSNTFINFVAGAGSRAEYLRFQDRALHHSQTARLNLHLDRDSSIRHCGIDLGGGFVRNDLKIDLRGPGAAASFDGLYVAAEGQHVDNHTRVDHRVGPTRSEQEYRGVLSGRSRAVWNGKAIVHKGADGTDARQANHNLLLSERAEIDAKPELEIYADEVKCAHGTTVGELDEQALFYLRSRGIGLARARRILTRAFAATVVDKAPVEELHESISHAVEQKLRAFDSGARP